MCVCLLIGLPSVQAQTDSAIQERWSQLKNGQLDVYGLSDEQVDQLIEAANQEILDNRLKLYPENDYYAEYPWRRFLISNEDQEIADALAWLYFRKAGGDPVSQKAVFDRLKAHMANYVPEEFRPPKLSDIDFEELTTNAEALTELMDELWHIDQFFNGWIPARDKAYEDARAILVLEEYGGHILNALMSPINVRHKSQLAAIAEKIILKSGWPNPEDVGARASQTLWLIIQHEDVDPEFQMAMLPILKKSVEEIGVSPRHYAYLEDRINVNYGRLQRFGTQIFGCDAATLVDASKVDKWRADFGLKPLAEYLSGPLTAHLGCEQSAASQ